ncbi:hypothetical protein HDE79_002337 [Rhodanobacter sp. MP1X3]|nr:hypothetical protein [Rhodanobacter sp. MP1X3]
MGTHHLIRMTWNQRGMRTSDKLAIREVYYSARTTSNRFAGVPH